MQDENISSIIAIKLIDFELVAFIEEGKVFNIFSGTLEYCSLEVLV